MNEHKRVQKTKKALREAIMNLIRETPFEKITVKGICEKAKISRLTFYSYYRDKYMLIDDVFNAFREVILQECHNKNLENNPERDYVKICCNLLSSIIDEIYVYIDLVKAINQGENPYVCFAFHTFVRNTIEQLVSERIDTDLLRYPLKPAVAFICSGMTAFLWQCLTLGYDKETVHTQSETLLIKLLSEEVFLGP